MVAPSSEYHFGAECHGRHGCPRRREHCTQRRRARASMLRFVQVPKFVVHVERTKKKVKRRQWMEFESCRSCLISDHVRRFLIIRSVRWSAFFFLEYVLQKVTNARDIQTTNHENKTVSPDIMAIPEFEPASFLTVLADPTLIVPVSPPKEKVLIGPENAPKIRGETAEKFQLSERRQAKPRQKSARESACTMKTWWARGNWGKQHRRRCKLTK